MVSLIDGYLATFTLRLLSFSSFYALDLYLGGENLPSVLCLILSGICHLDLLKRHWQEYNFIIFRVSVVCELA